MNLEEFTRFAQGLGCKCLSNGAFGVYKGYPFAATFNPRGGGAAVVTLSVTGKAGGKLVREVKKTLPKGCTFVLTAAGRYTLTCPSGGEGLERNFTAAMDAVISAFRDADLVPGETCPICKQEGCNATALVGGAYVKVHKDCVEQMSAGTMAKAEEAMQGNYVTGFIGAILGGVVGAIPATLYWGLADTLSYYLLALFYAIIPLCANFGYKLFKGKANNAAFFSTLIASVLNLFTVVYFSVYMMLGMARSALPTPGFAWRTMTDLIESGDLTQLLVLSVICMGLGLWFTWSKIRRTAVHDARDAGAVLATMVVNGEAPVNAAPYADPYRYTMVTPNDPAARD